MNQTLLKINKTHKMYVNGQFIRSESGQTFPVYTNDEKLFANLCSGSKKDLRNAIEVADSVLNGWQSKTSYLRGQIFYRIAEMLESRRYEIEKLISELYSFNLKSEEILNLWIDDIIHFAGFSDKYQQLLSNQNPVSSPHYNFTTTEPVGAVGYLFDDENKLQYLFHDILAVLVSGNVMVAMFAKKSGALISALGEIFNTSDLPPGVINLISIQSDDVVKTCASHRMISSMAVRTLNKELVKECRIKSTDNLKRFSEFKLDNEVSLASIEKFIEYKTIWHPIGS